MKNTKTLRSFVFAITLAATALAGTPIPKGMRGFLAQPPTTVEKQCEDESDPKCEKRTYTFTINVNEKFVQLPLSQQTPKILTLVKWSAEQLPEKPGVSFTFYAALNRQVLGWADGAEWVWEANYATEVNRRVIRGGK